MVSAPPPEVHETSLTHDLLYAVRYYLGGRRGLLLFASAALVPGLWLGWPALVAAGMAPILVALAPCAVMCALGLCMKRMGKTKVAGPTSETTAAASSFRALRSEAPDASLLEAGGSHCEGATEIRMPPSATPQIPQPQQEKNP